MYGIVVAIYHHNFNHNSNDTITWMGNVIDVYRMCLPICIWIYIG